MDFNLKIVWTSVFLNKSSAGLLSNVCDFSIGVRTSVTFVKNIQNYVCSCILYRLLYRLKCATQPDGSLTVKEFRQRYARTFTVFAAVGSLTCRPLTLEDSDFVSSEGIHQTALKTLFVLVKPESILIEQSSSQFLSKEKMTSSLADA